MSTAISLRLVFLSLILTAAKLICFDKEDKICVMLWGQSCCVVIQWRNLLLQDYDGWLLR